jgi:hypothetical protein
MQALGAADKLIIKASKVFQRITNCAQIAAIYDAMECHDV